MLIVLQITLGILTVLKRKPADVASAHVAVGALILATMFILSVWVIRLRAISQAAH
jgi:heme A synthase